MAPSFRHVLRLVAREEDEDIDEDIVEIGEENLDRMASHCAEKDGCKLVELLLIVGSQIIYCCKHALTLLA